MLKKVVKYVDFDEKERTDTLYFNLTKVEIMEFALSYQQDWETVVHEMVETNNQKGIFDLMKNLIMKSYGEKTADGKFIKTTELSEIFSHTEAYSQLIEDITSNDKEAVAFFNGILSTNVKLNKPKSEN